MSEQLEEMLAFAYGQRTGRLVHDDDGRVDAERGGNLDHLFLTGRKLADRTIHVDIGLNLGEHGPGLIAQFCAIHPTRAPRKIAEAKSKGGVKVAPEAAPDADEDSDPDSDLDDGDDTRIHLEKPFDPSSFHRSRVPLGGTACGSIDGVGATSRVHTFHNCG
jgi:hypothetical protein